MSAIRIAVEWGFGKILQHWAYLDFSKNQKVQKQAVSKEYFVGVLLTNFITCSSPETARFGISPPTITDYIHFTEH